MPTIVPERDYFKALLENKIAEFVEQELSPFFGNLIRFVNQLDHERDIMKVDAGILHSFVNEEANLKRFVSNSINHGKIICN